MMIMMMCLILFCVQQGVGGVLVKVNYMYR